MSEPGCHEVRDLLGVYVVGAIDPSDRAIADAHLSRCQHCREELAGLAGLPALLRRVPVAQAERIAEAGPARMPEVPPAELLSSLLAKMAARRRRGRVRAAFAIAAAVVVVAGGAVTATRMLTPAPAPVTVELAQASSGGYTASVRYYEGASPNVWVRVTGVPPGTTCRFWALTKDGRQLALGEWTTFGPQPIWYQLTSPVPSAQLASFLVTAHEKLLVRIPVT